MGELEGEWVKGRGRRREGRERGGEGELGVRWGGGVCKGERDGGWGGGMIMKRGW